MFDEVKRLNKKHTIKLAIFSGVAMGIVLVVMFVTVTNPKQRQFCINCHSNISLNTVCKKQSSKDIACSECHNHENKGAMVMGIKIKDEHCTTESCHPLSKLSATAVQYKKITPFEHKTHTGKFAENFQLKCTSCHANLGGEKHFETDTRTCNVCHFTDTPKHPGSQGKKPISDCALCHTHIEKTLKIYEKTFRHDMYEGNEKVSCSDCHFKIVQGNGKVDKESCGQCHVKVSGDFHNASDMHRIHSDTCKTDCTSCHNPITHGWIKVNNKIDGSGHNSQFVDTGSEVQNLMMMGRGGSGVEGEPDPMYLATLNCSACHKDTLFTNVKPQVCNNCHGRGFDKILFEQRRFVSFNLQLLKTLLIKAKRYQDVNTDRIIQEAEANYTLIKKDGSLGAHNIKYVKNLLGYCIGQLKQITKQNPEILSLHENL
ncbi:MAG: hypothetical protein E3K36_03180 [Candidatus Brocadia sp.]|nr:hypothetical protein [Candidatus Brocadia sp.]